MKNIFIIIICSILVLSIPACGERKNSQEAKPEEGHQDAHEHGNIAALTAEQVKSIQLQLGSIEKKQLTASLKANGILTVPNQNKATITALMGGVIKSILVQNGENVTKGQVIATIVNTSFITLQEEFLSASSKLTYAEIEYQRQQELQEGNASSLKNLQNAEAELKTLKARRASLQKQLELVGINTSSLTSDNLQTLINITSPIAGAVSTLSVNMGTYVDANNGIAEVIDNSQLHLDLFIYERDLVKLKEGQTIHFTLTNNPGKEYDAKIYAISNTFEQNTKAVAIHAMVEGDKTGLINGMSITAIVSLENATVDAVPTEAIVSYQGQDYILIVKDQQHEDKHHQGHAADQHDEHGHSHKDAAVAAQGDLTFERIPVRKGTTDVGYSEITVLKEIPLDAKIAVKGAFFVLAKMTNTGEHEH